MRRFRFSVRNTWLIVALCGISLAVFGVGQSDASSLTVYFLDVEQGNCILIVPPSGTAALIDAGTGIRGDDPSDDDPAALIQGLMRADLTFNLQYVIATHYDADHIGKLDEVLNAGLLGPNGTVFDRGDAESTDPAYVEYERSIGGHRRLALEPGTKIDLGGGAILSCVVVNGAYRSATGTLRVLLSESDENAHSAGLILTYGSTSFWFGGDLTSAVETALAPYVQDLDVYAANHHGSTTSSCPALLRALKPEYVVVQSGQENTYGHPNKAVVGTILSVEDSLGATPRVIYQNHAKTGDARSDDTLASAIADPDGAGPLPGTIVFRTDGAGDVFLTIPAMPSPSLPSEFMLLVSAAPQEGGTTTPAGAGQYSAGSTVTVAATPNSGYRFDHWEGDVSGTAASVEVAMTAARSLVAVFVAAQGSAIERGDLLIYSVLANATGSTAKAEIPNETITLKNMTNHEIDLLDPVPLTIRDENSMWTLTAAALDQVGLPHVIQSQGTWSVMGTVYNPSGSSSLISLRNTGETITILLGGIALDCWTYPDASNKEGQTLQRTGFSPGTCGG